MKRELVRAGGALAFFVMLVVGLGLFTNRVQQAGASNAATATTREQTGARQNERGGPDGRGSYFVGEELVPPRPAADFELTDWTGQQVRLRDLKGKAVLLTFAYTSCPDACPMLAARFNALQSAMAGHVGKDLELAFITVDPDVDTPEHLAGYMESMGAKWHFLSGRPAALQRVWTDYRIRVEKEGDQVAHGNLIYAIDGNGLIKLRYLGVPPEHVLVSDLEKLIG